MRRKVPESGKQINSDCIREIHHSYLSPWILCIGNTKDFLIQYIHHKKRFTSFPLKVQLIRFLQNLSDFSGRKEFCT
jgi:hypothetical protein